MDHGNPPVTSENVKYLYIFLLAGVVILAVMFGLTHYVLGGPIIRDGSADSIGLAMAGIGFTVLAVSGVLIRGRIPLRRSGVSSDQYWADERVLVNAPLLWFLVEGAAILSGMGYLLTGSRFAGGVLLLGIAALTTFRPSHLERLQP
jgi:hypothetical protein